MTTVKYSLAYTSHRAQLIEHVVDLWRGKMAKTVNNPIVIKVEIILSIDQDYTDGLAVGKKLAETNKIDRLVVNTGPANCVAGWNAAAAVATGDVIIAVADDFSPPQDWDASLAKIYPGWWTHDHAVWVSDGYNTNIQTLTIFSRPRYARFGYLFYTGYESLFSDTENTAVANMEGATLDARNITFEHLHPDCGKRGRDEVDNKHTSQGRWKRGETLFKFRQLVGFPLDAGPNAKEYNPEARLDFALYVQAIKDDIALYDVCARIIEEGRMTPHASVTKVYLCVPDEYWSGRATTDAERKQVVAVGDRLNRAYGPTTQTIVFSLTVGVHRTKGRPRIDIETAVRNDSIQAIRQHGKFKHILVADGDELWRPGLLNELCVYVREHHPAGVYTGMVPVVGLPGFAVDRAADKATIYVSDHTFFTDCRGTSGHRHELPGNLVIHFSCVRPTIDAIVEKSRGSGHFDDQSYDFEGWIKNTLPHIKRDSKNLHMYKGPNIWPALRPWTKEEWADIPAALKKYLDDWHG